MFLSVIFTSKEVKMILVLNIMTRSNSKQDFPEIDEIFTFLEDFPNLKSKLNLFCFAMMEHKDFTFSHGSDKESMIQILLDKKLKAEEETGNVYFMFSGYESCYTTPKAQNPGNAIIFNSEEFVKSIQRNSNEVVTKIFLDQYDENNQKQYGSLGILSKDSKDPNVDNIIITFNDENDSQSHEISLNIHYDPGLHTKTAEVRNFANDMLLFFGGFLLEVLEGVSACDTIKEEKREYIFEKIVNSMLDRCVINKDHPDIFDPKMAAEVATDFGRFEVLVPRDIEFSFDMVSKIYINNKCLDLDEIRRIGEENDRNRGNGAPNKIPDISDEFLWLIHYLPAHLQDDYLIEKYGQYPLTFPPATSTELGKRAGDHFGADPDAKRLKKEDQKEVGK